MCTAALVEWLARRRSYSRDRRSNDRAAMSGLSEKRPLYLFPRLVAGGKCARTGIARVRFDTAGDPVGVERMGIAPGSGGSAATFRHQGSSFKPADGQECNGPSRADFLI